MKTSPRIKRAITAIPPTAPPTIAPMGIEDFPPVVEVEVAVEEEGEDEAGVEVLVWVPPPLSALVMMLVIVSELDALLAVVGS